MTDVKYEPTLHGWDDEKVYYIDQTGKEWCASDYTDLMAQLLEICQEHFARKVAAAPPERLHDK